MFYLLTYEESGDFTLKSERGQILTGHGPDELFRLPEAKSYIYDENLSITRYLIGEDVWDDRQNAFKDGETNKLFKGTLTFINSRNVADNLTINKIKTLRKEYKKLPTSQAALVRERLKELQYPDFKCWMTNEAYFKVIKYVMPGALSGYNPAYTDIELSACAWDIKSCYPSIMVYKRFPERFLQVSETDDLEVLDIYKHWIAAFDITGIELRADKCIDWLQRREDNIYGFTSLDFEMFTSDYTFDYIHLRHIIIHSVMVPLPDTIRNFIKTSLLNKDAHKNSATYEEAKRNSNIIYGTFYGIPQRQDTENGYRLAMREEKRRASIVGVWVTSYARYQLWKALSICPEAVIYWNTDGFVTLADISAEIKKLNVHKYKNFGNFSLKYNYAECIILGNSQIYIGGNLKCAGLSSDGGNQFLRDRGIKPYRGLVIPPEYSGRWTYHDNRIDKIGYTIGGEFNL